MLLLRPEVRVVIATSEAKIMSLILYCAFDSAKFTVPNLVQQWTNKAVGVAEALISTWLAWVEEVHGGMLEVGYAASTLGNKAVEGVNRI